MSRWQALVNISFPRKGDAGKQTDLILKGETFTADDNQVQNLLHPTVGPPRIRRIEEQGLDLPLILPKQISGSLRGPEVGARPDPKGSSQILIPELAEPMPDSEQKSPEDAVDIPPRGARGRTAAGAKAG